MSESFFPFEKYLDVSKVRNTAEEMRLSEDKEAELINSYPFEADYQTARKTALEKVFDAQNHLILIASKLAKGNSYDEKNYFAQYIRKHLADWMYNYCSYGGAVGNGFLVKKYVDETMVRNVKPQFELNNFLMSIAVNLEMKHDLLIKKIEKNAKQIIPKEAEGYFNWKRAWIDVLIVLLMVLSSFVPKIPTVLFMIPGLLALLINGQNNRSTSINTHIDKVYYAPQKWDLSWNKGKISNDNWYSFAHYSSRVGKRKVRASTFNTSWDQTMWMQNEQNRIFMQQMQDEQDRLFMQQVQDEQNQLFMQQMQDEQNQLFIQQMQDEQNRLFIQQMQDEQNQQTQQIQDQFNQQQFDQFIDNSCCSFDNGGFM